jgi:hypothetical protein
VQALQPTEALETSDIVVPKLPASWDSIEVGHQVVAQADDPSLGWWDVTCEAIDGDMLTLRSSDFPDITVSRHRYAVALQFTPKYAPPSDLNEAAPGLPTDWTTLKESDLVLAHEGKGEGWWEALLVEVNDQETVVRWRDYPKAAKLGRAINQIALLYPKAPESR